jgi:hypothetical protein
VEQRVGPPVVVQLASVVDFFSPERGDAAGSDENGIPLCDLVWMDQDL